MKIALYVPSWPPGLVANGIVTYASNLVPALRRLGHEVFVLTHGGVAVEDPYTIDLRNFATPATLWNQVMFRFAPETAFFNTAISPIALAIRHLVEKRGIEIFELEESFGWSFAITRLKLVPVVVRLHGPWILNGRLNDPDDEIENRRRQERERTGICHAHFVTSPSAAVLQAVKDRYGLNLTASTIIPNPLDVADAADTWEEQTCNPQTLLFVGRFDKLKGGDLVLRVFADLAVSYPSLILTFVGPNNGIKGTDGKLILFEEYIHRNIPESCRSRIKFRGQINYSELMSLRTKNLVTVVASQYENMPYSVLEAMSLGCPLVATAVGGVPELIQDQRNGLLVPSQDVKAMTVACKKLLEDHALAARLGRQAWRDCRDFYGSDNIAKQTIAAYENAIDKFHVSERS